MVRPQKLLMENVAALLHRGMGEVCGELAESGYDAEWDCIPACAVGAPHQRDRVFIVADAQSREQQEQQAGNAGYQGRREAKKLCVTRTGGGDKSRYLTERTEPSARDSKELPTNVANTTELFGYGGGNNAGISTQSQQVSEFRDNGGKARMALECFRRTIGRCQWDAEPNVGRMADGVPFRTHRLRCVGNSVSPQVAEYLGKLLKETK